MTSVNPAVEQLKAVLSAKPFDANKLAELVGNDDLSHEDAAWPALDAICDFLHSSEFELVDPRSVTIIRDLLRFLAFRANPREFVLAISDHLMRVKTDLAWSSLLRPLAISVSKHLSNRAMDGTIEDALQAAISHIAFIPQSHDETSDPVEVAEINCHKVLTFIDEFFAEEYPKEAMGMHIVATCLTLAASPLCTSFNGEAVGSWKTAVNRLSKIIILHASPNSILEDVTDISHRHDRFLGHYFFNNVNGQWGLLKPGLACLLAANDSDFALPQMLDPRYRFFLCSNIAAELLTQITITPNPDMDLTASGYQCTLACKFISSLLSSIPPDSLSGECLSVPAFTLLIRRLFTNLTGTQSSQFTIDTESAGNIVNVIDEFITRFDLSGKWQLVWMWVNQVPSDSHPAGPVRAVAIDKCRQLLAYSVKSKQSLLSERLAKMLPMLLALSLARDNVSEGQPGLVRVDAAISVLSLLQYILLVQTEEPLIDQQTRKTLGAWLEYEFRPAVAATKNFLTGAATLNPNDTPNTSNLNPWKYLSAQLMSRLDLVQYSLARVETIISKK